MPEDRLVVRQRSFGRSIAAQHGMKLEIAECKVETRFGSNIEGSRHMMILRALYTELSLLVNMYLGHLNGCQPSFP